MPVLDGLRGVAILLVLITHFCVFSYRPFVDLVFMKVAALGWIGVDLFFVLSGYLITGLLSDAKGKPWYFRTFYARRVLRIFPLYYGFLVVLFLVVPLLLSDRPALVQSIKHGEGWYWTYAVNIFLAAGEWEAKSLQRTGHFWSLAIEEQFYLLWPLVVLICRRRTLMWVCAGAILSSFLIRCGMLAVHATPDMVYLLLPSRMDDLAVGAAIALGARNPRGLTAWFRPALIATGVAGAGLSGIVILDHGFDAFGMPMQTVGYTLLAVVLGGVLLIALVTRPPLLADSRLVFFGRYSYGIYVLHPLCLSLLPWLGFSPDRFPTLSGSHIPGVLVFASVAISVSVGFALISWHCYEKHFLKLKRWFPYRHALVEQAAVPALDPHGSFATASSRLGQASDG